MLRQALICFLVGQTALAEPLPFWKAKDKVYSRISNGEIIVSVKTEASQMTVAGGGHVRAPVAFVFDYACDFEHLDHLGLYVEKAHYNPQTSIIDLTFKALGRQADFKVLVQRIQKDDLRRLQFEIVGGPLKGLKGALDFHGLTALKTEVGIGAEFKYSDAGMFKWVLEFGLEVMFQKMAARLRDRVQTAYRGISACGGKSPKASLT